RRRLPRELDASIAAEAFIECAIRIVSIENVIKLAVSDKDEPSVKPDRRVGDLPGQDGAAQLDLRNATRGHDLNKIERAIVVRVGAIVVSNDGASIGLGLNVDEFLVAVAELRWKLAGHY